MQIIQEKNNSLLNRKEIQASIESVATPSKKEIIKLIGNHFKKDENCVVIETIKAGFGTKNAVINVKVYDNVESKIKFETLSKKQKAKIAEEEAKKVNAQGGSE
ncbi:MAG TPA: hypothetical protein P5277_02000 [Candidatus Paceibacterota bacterium]|nr:hypothetical protein [Candidatus Paceibacterota bacterium]